MLSKLNDKTWIDEQNYDHENWCDSDYYVNLIEHYKNMYPRFWIQLVNYDKSIIKKFNCEIYELNDKDFKNYVKVHKWLVKKLKKEFY